jgi:hypothetical protein
MPDGLHLADSSPLRNAGVASSRWNALECSSDFEGDLRDATPDIGVDEHAP